MRFAALDSLKSRGSANRIFPWQEFSRLLVIQTALFLALLGILALGARTFLQHQGLPAEAARQWDRLLAGFLLAASIAVAGYAWFFNRRVALPEWLEMESTLDRVRTDLDRKTDLLGREREELATLMSAISDGILAVNRDGRPLFFNSRFALLFLDKQLSTQAPHLGEIFRAPEVLATFKETFTEGAPREISLPLFVRGESAPRFFSLSIAPLQREGGEVYGAVGIFHDVTELKRAETIRIEFVANVSHELRTPLTSIKGYTDTLREDVAKNPQAFLATAPRFLDIITRNVDRLMNLLNDLLDLSSLESAESDALVRTPVHLQDMTERVLAGLESRRAERGHRISTRYDAQLLPADPRRLEQVLINLLENAIKYVPPGGEIQVLWEKAADAIQLRVSDNGPGIPREHHARLFERFYRVDKARSRDQGGTGLGLAIVKHILQRHGGTVTLESEPGRGTTFICRFPLGR